MIYVERFRKAYKHSKARKFELKISGFALYDHSAVLLLTLNAVEKETIVSKRKRRLVEREGQIKNGRTHKLRPLRLMLFGSRNP